MTNFVENAFSNGKYRLPISIKKLELAKLNDVLCREIKALSVPKNQSLTETWNLYLMFKDSINALKVTAQTTGIGDWDEMGSLEIEMVAKRDEGVEFQDFHCGMFEASKAYLLQYRDETVEADLALELENKEGDSIVISVSNSPGAISVSAPFYEGGFLPEITVTKLQRTLI